jgi:hypothetical protein
VVDKLVNEGVSSQVEDILIEAQQLPTPPLLLHCMEIALRDCPPLDGVTTDEHACWAVNNLSQHPFPQSLPHEYHSLDGNGGATALKEIFNGTLKVRAEVYLA